MGVQSHRRRKATRARSAGTAALFLLSALGLAACGTNHKLPVASSADLPAAAPVVTASPEPAAPPPETVPAEPLEAAVEPVATPPAPPSFETAEPADPDAVMGLARNEVAALLGKPGLVRREAPAEVWQYQSRGCILDVFLYETSADYEVVYVEARTVKALAAATARCLGAVMNEHRRTPVS